MLSLQYEINNGVVAVLWYLFSFVFNLLQMVNYYCKIKNLKHVIIKILNINKFMLNNLLNITHEILTIIYVLHVQNTYNNVWIDI